MHMLDAALPPSEILSMVGDGVRQLVIANQVLFQGSWDDMAEDQRRRRAGRPYLFRLDIALPGDALEWIQRIHTYELARGETLASALVKEDLQWHRA